MLFEGVFRTDVGLPNANYGGYTVEIDVYRWGNDTT